MTNYAGRHRYRSLWISDVHLGTRGCRAEYLLQFLETYPAETIYLVGDIVDGWRLQKGWYWPRSHNALLQALLQLAATGARVIYIPGNHDHGARQFCGLNFGGIQVCSEAIHTTPDGRRLLVVHGDQQEALVRWHSPLTLLGDRAYDALVGLNTVLDALRRRLGLPYWSLAAHMKRRAPAAMAYIDSYRRTLLTEARARGLDGVVCGHIHHGELLDEDGLVYANTGDWVESCTALIERHSGALHLMEWREEQRQPGLALAMAA